MTKEFLSGATNQDVGPFGGGKTVTALGAAMMLVFASICVRADQVEMQNGDRYVGNVVSLNAEVLVLQSDVLGTVKLPRGKVAQITMGPGVAAAAATKAVRTNLVLRGPTVTPTNSAPVPSPSFPQLQADASVMQQVQAEFLGDASPEAKAKFNELAAGLLSGKVSVSDIRVEAKSAVDQLRALKASLGEEADTTLDGYVAILDNFLNETKPSGGSATNAAGAVTKPKAE